ncbi:MAG: glutathione S-transferase [Halioglobus sp.]|jgi:glutathione S-transferase
MEYVSVEQAKNAIGLRLVLTGGLPAPWSEAAKGVLKAHNIDFVPVLQIGGGTNEEILEWTGHRNAPTLMYNEEPSRATPVEIINFAERLGSGPSLVPSKIDDRIQMFGLINEIAGENGMAWNARVIMLKVMAQSMSEEVRAGNPMFETYRFSASDADSAPAKIISVLNVLTAQLQRQEERGSPYFIGDDLTALDIYWACFSQMLSPLPVEVNPMPDYMRKVWGLLAQTVEQAGYTIDSKLLKHRNFIFPKHLQWPLDF